MGKGKANRQKSTETPYDEGGEYDVDIEAIVNVQLDCVSRVQKFLINFAKDPADRKSKRIYYQTKFEVLAKIVASFEANHRILVEQIPRKEQGMCPYFSEDISEQFENAQIDYLNVLQSAHDERFPDETNARSNENEFHLKSGVTLPTVSIPNFSGAHTEWKTFYDLFRSIVHKNEKLPGSHKFQYLLGALSGDARDLIAGFDVCDDDYPKAWKLLTEIYNDKPSMFVHIMNKFSGLEPAVNENADHLRELVKSTSACFKSLASIGILQENVDAIITYYLIRKLPVGTLAYWEEIRNRKSLPSFDALKACIETRIRVCATISSIKSEMNVASSSVESKAENNKYHQFKSQPPKKKNIKSYHSSSKQTSSAVPASLSSNPPEKKFSCPVCNGDGHPLRTCDKFLSASAAERKTIINKIQHCMNCLAYNHHESKCRSSHTCFTCGERHHSLLHTSKASAETVNRVAAHTLASVPSSVVEYSSCNTRTKSPSNSVLLATAIVTVLDVDGEAHAFRALIDQGSEASFITESALLALRLPKTSVQAIINGIGTSNSQSKHMTSFTLRSPNDVNFSINVEALVMGKITNLLPSSSIKSQLWSHLIDLTLADPSYNRTGRIDLILGSDVFAQILMEGVRIGPEGSPVAQQTHLGWILSGKISNEPQRGISVTTLHATSSIESLMERFLAAESVEDANPLSSEEQWCEKFFMDTHCRNEEGRFKVRLPFRFHFDSSAMLGRSREIAIKRLLQLERRFSQDIELKKEYSKAINEHVALGRMQPTTSDELERENHTCASAYLPHHAVIKDSSSSTKLRVVFDASRKTSNGKSLNDVLLVGPTIQSDIVTIIVNWRFHRIAFTADVQKMYLQVMVDPQDIEYQRIVWRNNPTEPIKDYSLNRLTFGTSCAPYIAIKSMKQLADYEKEKYPEAAVVIANDTYVDDVISGGDDVPSVQKLQQDLSMLMQSGGFDLKKWSSNCNEILQQIPEADREVKVPV